jgi:quercetin dioxygenase-like cupin family protein
MRVQRTLVTIAAACLLAAAVVSARQAGAPIARSARDGVEVVPLDKDPHHHVLLDTILLRVLDINIPPGVTTPDHRHDRDIASVALEDGVTRTRAAGEQDWGPTRNRARGEVNMTMYTGMPGVHRLETLGTPYHLIAVENNRAGGWLQTKPMTAAGAKVLQQNRAFIAYDVEMPAGAKEANHPHEMPVVIVLLSGAIEISGNGGSEPSRVTQPGQWVLIPGGHNLGVVGSNAAHVVEIEIR